VRTPRPVSRAALAVATAATLVVLGGCAIEQPTLVPDTKVASHLEVDKRVFPSDAALEEQIDATQPGCSGAVGVRGEIVWAGARGIADLSTGTPVTIDTRFDTASVAKQFTATAVLMLQREGLLSLSDPVGRYVDRLPAWGSTVTLDQLLHHTSRVRDYWVRLDADGLGFSDPVSHEYTLDAIRRLPRLSETVGYEYSNSNYVLLAEVVQRVSGVPFPQFLDERIFTPLGLDMVLSPGLVAPDVALSYDDNLQLQPPGWAAYGAIGIYTTPSQLARWGDQYREGEIVQDDFAVGAIEDGTGDLYAAGVYIQPDGDLSHNGRFGGYVTAFTVSADRETTIVVMCNGHLSNRFGLAGALWEIWGTPAEGADE
jgi:CubicO group peptidase (beta-lactamase class C family)